MLPIAALALIAILGGGYFLTQGEKKGTGTTSGPSPTMVREGLRNATQGAQPTTAAAEVSTGTYKNGEYSATGDYVSPGGPEQVGVKLTLVDDVITAVDFTSMAERPNSVKFQGQFAEGYKDLVLGKNIDEVQLTKVSGSSLTPKGFTDALEKIKAEAKS